MHCPLRGVIGGASRTSGYTGPLGRHSSDRADIMARPRTGAVFGQRVPVRDRRTRIAVQWHCSGSDRIPTTGGGPKPLAPGLPRKRSTPRQPKAGAGSAPTCTDQPRPCARAARSPAIAFTWQCGRTSVSVSGGGSTPQSAGSSGAEWWWPYFLGQSRRGPATAASPRSPIGAWPAKRWSPGRARRWRGSRGAPAIAESPRSGAPASDLADKSRVPPTRVRNRTRPRSAGEKRRSP